MARDTWYRLDSVGKFYSSQAGSTSQTVFRFSATLVDEVDAEILQRAVNKTVDAFPSFNVCLRSGMFWHYLEQVKVPPTVLPENLPICFGLHVDAKSVLMRVSYYQHRINLEVSHMVSDGRGTTNFFKALLYAYLQERYSVEGVTLEYDGSDHQKFEDSFDKYFEKGRVSAAPSEEDEAGAQSKKRKIYHINSWRDEADPTYMEYHLPTQSVRALAHEYGVSITSLIIAVLMGSIRKEMLQRQRKREIRVDIPVDLRAIFESATTKNFYGMTYVSYVPTSDLPVRELAVQVHKQLESATETERLMSYMNSMLKFEKNPVLRLAPLFIKDLVLEIVDRHNARGATTTVSNLGRIKLDEQLRPYVCDINVLTSTKGLNFVLCSFEDDLSICISSIYANLDIVKHFCRFFSAQGIEGHLNTSKTKEELEVDWREVQIEASVKRLGGQLPESEDEDGAEKPKKAAGEKKGKKREKK